MISDVQKPINPLTGFMRQPKIYIRLPSKGEYWTKGSIEIPENQEIAVYSMTAKDELLLKVPDALMNGQAVVDVIQHCIPAIKNAWETPATDIDTILIALRLATYGEKMNATIKISDDQEMEYRADLRDILDGLLRNVTWDPIVSISDEMTVFVRPLPYKVQSKVAIQSFETQRLINLANDSNTSDDDKIKIFKESFDKLSEVAMDTVANSIERIDTSLGSTDDPKFIREFLSNADKDIFKKIQDHIEKLQRNNNLKPIRINVTNEMKEHGIKEDFIEVPLIFDASNFFA